MTEDKARSLTAEIKSASMLLRDFYLREHRRVLILEEALETVVRLAGRPCVVDTAEKALSRSHLIRDEEEK